MDLGPIRAAWTREDGAMVVKYDNVTAYYWDKRTRWVDYNFLGRGKAGLTLAEARARLWADLHKGKFQNKGSGSSPQYFVKIRL
jgi:hypothetical protein